jgi:hypothetical protein
MAIKGNKVVRVSEGNYKVKVQDGGTITLDTGVEQGTVYVTGSLVVDGQLTYLNVQDLQVEDNLIILNRDDLLGSTVTKPDPEYGGAGVSGIRIIRGAGDEAELVWHEINHYNPATDSSIQGLWSFRVRTPGSPSLAGIRTNQIDTNGGILGLINTGNGYVTVRGTTNYERQILSYTDTVGYDPTLGVSIIDDDRIPNIKAISDFTAYSLAVFTAKRFGSFDTIGEGFDTANGDAVSQLEFKVDNVLEVVIDSAGLLANNVRIGGNTINTTSNALTLTANNGLIQVAGYLTLIDQGSDPALLGGATKLYTKTTVGGGDTGIYYVNSRTDTDGSTVITMTEELISRKRALLLSFIF